MNPGHRYQHDETPRWAIAPGPARFGAVLARGPEKVHPARKRTRVRRARHGFTLIELLVVVAVISLLVALLLPVLSRARKEAERALCRSNLHQIVVAVTGYANDNRRRTPRLTMFNGGVEDARYGTTAWFPDPQYGAGAVYAGYFAGPVGLGLLVPEYVSVADGRIFFCPTQSDKSHVYDQPVIGWHQWGNPIGQVMLGYFTRESSSVDGPIRALVADMFYAGANRTGHLEPRGDYLCYSDGSVRWVFEEGSLWQSGIWYPSTDSQIKYVWDYFDREYRTRAVLD